MENKDWNQEFGGQMPEENVTAEAAAAAEEAAAGMEAAAEAAEPVMTQTEDLAAQAEAQANDFAAQAEAQANEFKAQADEFAAQAEAQADSFTAEAESFAEQAEDAPAKSFTPLDDPTYHFDQATEQEAGSYRFDQRASYGPGSSAYNAAYAGNGDRAGASQNYGYAAAGAATTAAAAAARRKKAERKPLNITRAGFVLTLILCMLITSAATFGAMVLYDKATTPAQKPTQATNYTPVSSDATLSTTSVVEKNEDAIVAITTESVTTDFWAQNYVTEGAGSGIIIDPDGYIMTCSHVVEDASKITVTLNNNKSYDATLVGIDVSQEVAVLKIDAKDLTAVTYGNSDDLRVGETAIAIGNPLGTLSGTVTTGIISSLDRELSIDGKNLSLLQTDASVNPGNSGGGLFDASGNLIGLVVAKSTGSDVEGIGFAIPVNHAAEIAKGLIEDPEKNYVTGEEEDEQTDIFPFGLINPEQGQGGQNGQMPGQNGQDSQDSQEASDHGMIGVIVSTLTESQAEQNNFTEGAGVYIIRLSSTSAKRAGLQRGDRITACEGTEVSSYDDLQKALSGHKAGSKVTLTISRGGRTADVTVTLS